MCRQCAYSIRLWQRDAAIPQYTNFATWQFCHWHSVCQCDDDDDSVSVWRRWQQRVSVTTMTTACQCDDDDNSVSVWWRWRHIHATNASAQCTLSHSTSSVHLMTMSINTYYILHIQGTVGAVVLCAWYQTLFLCFLPQRQQVPHLVDESTTQNITTETINNCRQMQATFSTHVHTQCMYHHRQSQQFYAMNIESRLWCIQLVVTVTVCYSHTSTTSSNFTGLCCYHRSVYISPDAIPPIHAVSYHVATDKVPAQCGDKFRSIFSDNLQPIATRGKKACGTAIGR